MRAASIMGAALVACGIGLSAAAVPAEQGPAASKQAPRPEMKIRRQLELLGSRDARIGVSVRDLDPEKAPTAAGAVVDKVVPDSPAEKAGIKAGDVVTSFDGEKVRSAKQLARLVGETAPGRTVAATVMRDGKSVDVQLKPEPGGMARFDGEFTLPPMESFDLAPEWKTFDRHFGGPGSGELFQKPVPGGEGRGFRFFMNPGRGRLGIGLQDITPQLAEYFGARHGALVTTVEKDSPAGRAGLKAGDVITAINGKTVESAGDIAHAVNEAADDAELAIDYVRDRRSTSMKVKLEPRQERKQPETSGRPI